MKHFEWFGDASRYGSEKITGDSQCMDGVLNEYKDSCMDLLGRLDKFVIKHVPREDNVKANSWAQQASGYIIKHGEFEVHGEPMLCVTMNVVMSNGESAIQD
jgi:hypothetical protein